MVALPPVFTPADFAQLAILGEHQVEQRYRKPIMQLHAFLNEAPETRGLQIMRRDWTRPRYPHAFGNFNAEDRRWYTFNTSGRNEAQLNIGMFGPGVGPEHPAGYLRVGVAFEMTLREGGAPDRVWGAYSGFAYVLKADHDEWAALARTREYWVETSAGDSLRHVPPAKSVGWLVDPPPSSIWIFFGRLIASDAEASVLGDAERLAQAIRQVLGDLVPLWRASMRRAKARGLIGSVV